MFIIRRRVMLISTIPVASRELRYTTIAAIAVAASHFDLMGRSAYATFMRLSLITICFLIEAAALITLRFRRAA